jgi:hypothetical protein
MSHREADNQSFKNRISVRQVIVERQRAWKAMLRARLDGVFKTPASLIRALVENQKDAPWWEPRADLMNLRTMGAKLIHRLDLRENDEVSHELDLWAKDKGSVTLALPLVKIEKMNIRTLADYRPQADGYAIAGTIVINEERLRLLDPVMKWVLMLVMLIRVRQHLRGGDGRLDREGRALLKSKGVVVPERGKITITKDGAFRRLLESEGIEAPVTSEFKRPERKGKTTLQLWSCTCQKCRVGTKVFLATCTQCNQPFRPDDHVGKRFVS